MQNSTRGASRVEIYGSDSEIIFWMLCVKLKEAQLMTQEHHGVRKGDDLIAGLIGTRYGFIAK